MAKRRRGAGPPGGGRTAGPTDPETKSPPPAVGDETAAVRDGALEREDPLAEPDPTEGRGIGAEIDAPTRSADESTN